MWKRLVLSSRVVASVASHQLRHASGDDYSDLDARFGGRKPFIPKKPSDMVSDLPGQPSPMYNEEGPMGSRMSRVGQPLEERPHLQAERERLLKISEEATARRTNEGWLDLRDKLMFADIKTMEESEIQDCLSQLELLRGQLPEVLALQGSIIFQRRGWDAFMAHLGPILTDDESFEQSDAILTFVDATFSSAFGMKVLRNFLDESPDLRQHQTRMIIADHITRTTERDVNEDGEGKAAKELVELLQHCRRVLGEDQHMQLVTCLMASADETMFAASQQSAKGNNRDSLRTCIVVYRSLLHTGVLKLLDDSGRTALRSEYHVFLALRMMGRRSEAFTVGKRVVKMCDDLGIDPKVDDVDDSLRMQATLLGMLHDRLATRRDPNQQFLVHVIDRMPNNGVPWRFLAMDMQREKRYSDALVAIKKALSLNPLDRMSLVVLAELYHNLDRHTLAEEVKFLYHAAAKHIEDAEQGNVDRAERDAITANLTNIAEKESTTSEPQFSVDEVYEDYSKFLKHLGAAHLYGTAPPLPARQADIDKLQDRPAEDDGSLFADIDPESTKVWTTERRRELEEADPVLNPGTGPQAGAMKRG